MGRDEFLEQRYPCRFGDVTGTTGGYVKPKSDLLCGIVWMWLKWHKNHNIGDIRNDLIPVVTRAITLNADPKVCQRMREDHDSFIIQLSILCGVKKLMCEAVESVLCGEQESKVYQFYQAWTGILKYRILGDEREVQKQYEIMQRYKTLRYYVFPTKKTVETFVKKDYKGLHKAIKQRSEQFWKFAEQWGAIREENSEKIVDVKKFSENFFWPWVECTFAKLAYLDGADITYDSVWLPLDLVKAIER
ncbi:MAG TPA: hypothetical protein PKB02_10920 [Anaerohalosphaeraceae bacterium]|nr:hypothetical protein [Anaerohalosphaeraceae bacterium]